MKVFKKEGLKGFYRGCVPPFFGSIIYRTSQFAVFESVYTKFMHDPLLTRKIPFTGGIEPRVLLGGVTASLARSLIECPFEYIKVRRQVG